MSSLFNAIKRQLWSDFIDNPILTYQKILILNKTYMILIKILRDQYYHHQSLIIRFIYLLKQQHH